MEVREASTLIRSLDDDILSDRELSEELQKNQKIAIKIMFRI